MVTDTEAKLNSHEAVCQIRYDSICARLKRIEQILIGSAGFIILTLITLVLKVN
jgi:hypothetical protein